MCVCMCVWILDRGPCVCVCVFKEMSGGHITAKNMPDSLQKRRICLFSVSDRQSKKNCVFKVLFNCLGHRDKNQTRE